MNVDRIRPDERRLRRAAVVFAVAVLLHGLDHFRRGVDTVTAEVLWAGNLQFVLAGVAVALVYRRHPWAAPAAVAVGFAGAIGFIAVHFVPDWGTFSDSFVGSRVAPGVTALSWAAALFEVGADLMFGWAGLRVFIAESERRAVPVDAR